MIALFLAAAVSTPPAPLRPVASFAKIVDRAARSRALFVEAGRVIQHPRCVNCHPRDRSPRQNDDRRRHVPPINAGDGMGTTAALICSVCHHARNTAVTAGRVRSIPGDPAWMLAPKSMAWEGRSLGAICRQLKDPARNGGRSLAQIRHHMATDHLVGWGWHPGAGRSPVPGTQAQFGRLIGAWIATGAACPR